MVTEPHTFSYTVTLLILDSMLPFLICLMSRKVPYFYCSYTRKWAYLGLWGWIFRKVLGWCHTSTYLNIIMSENAGASSNFNEIFRLTQFPSWYTFSSFFGENSKDMLHQQKLKERCHENKTKKSPSSKMFSEQAATK